MLSSDHHQILKTGVFFAFTFCTLCWWHILYCITKGCFLVRRSMGQVLRRRRRKAVPAWPLSFPLPLFITPQLFAICFLLIIIILLLLLFTLFFSYCFHILLMFLLYAWYDCFCHCFLWKYIQFEKSANNIIHNLTVFIFPVRVL